VSHISPDTLRFLSELRQHNERGWFNANKARYDDARRDLTIFVDQLIGEISAFDSAVAGIEGKDSIFRIHRDARFSKDKTPYKTNLGAHIVAGARKTDHGRAGYYIHIEPGECMLAGGAYMPPGAWLADIRRAIERDGARLRKIVARQEFKKYFGTITGEQVKTAPRGYAKDHPEIDLLRYKSLVAIHNLADQRVTEKGFVGRAAKTFKAMKPFNDFLNGGRG
jgi:uncharacterized protein (TIGR02453 family)